MQLIHGQVVDSQGRPLAQAAIYVISGPVAMPDIAQVTDDQGRFTLAAPVAGNYRIGARAEPWGTVQADVEVIASQPASIKLKFLNS